MRKSKLRIRYFKRLSRIDFHDLNAKPCSLQLSSVEYDGIATIWFGIERVKPLILSENGVVVVPLPDNAIFNARMHLSQEQLRGLMPYLQRFIETGELIDHPAEDQNESSD